MTRSRFHLDKHIDSAIARALRAASIDVTTTEAASLRAQDDYHQMAFAKAEHRTLVTDDVDFLQMASTLTNRLGIVVCHRNSRTLGDMTAR
jgi:predicted nuclease of predicted toxin-antitoxin system